MTVYGNTKEFCYKAFLDGWDFTTDVDDVTISRQADGRWKLIATAVTPAE